MHILVMCLAVVGAITVLRYVVPLIGLLLWACWAGVAWLWERLSDYN